MTAITEVVVIGAGGLGREVRDAIDAVERDSGMLRFRGYLDDSSDLADVLGSTDLVPHFDISTGFLVAVGDPGLRKELVNRIGARRFVSVIHSTAVVSASASVAAGTFIAPFAYVGAGARVGGHSIVNVHAQVGHDARVGEFASLSPLATLSGGSEVGIGCFLGTAALLDVGVTVGEWSKVSAGAWVTKDVVPGSLVAGNPAVSRRMFRLPSEPDLS